MKKFTIWGITFIIIYIIILYHLNDNTSEFLDQIKLNILFIIILASLNYETIEKAMGTYMPSYNIKNIDKTPLPSPLDIRIKGYDFSFLRGDKYLLSDGTDKTVFISTWNILHFISYLIGGYICNKLFLLFLFSGIWWEVLESFKEVDCYDYSDVLYNIAGLAIGIKLKQIRSK